MNFRFTEEQEALREMARAFLAEHAGPAAARAVMESELGHDPALFKKLARELGWAGVLTPEAHGGIGLGPVELIALMELQGEALLCAPYFATVCLATNAILQAANEEQKRALLPALAAGEMRASLAFPTSAAEDGVRFCEARDGYQLSGRLRFVPDGHCADLLLVAARDAHQVCAIFALPASALASAQVTRTPLPTLDATRRLAQVELRELALPKSARLGDARDDQSAALTRTLDLARVALAAEQVGGAARCLEMAVAYARERVQFGRVIGSFQALKHKMADMHVHVESARSAVYYAAAAAQENAHRAAPARLASMAKAVASDAFCACAAEALQIFGGVGFTWEYDVQLYFKRAHASAVLLGAADEHRERVALELAL